ncbi:extracellular solute-binding protein [Candidatus Nomurabacteria bacterium]|nr:extracellular solute-binding protein [Candidatus Nomurabacteria bacterium]
MKASNFQLIVLAIFVSLIIVGVGTFAIFTSGGGSGTGRVEIWGTVESTVMDRWFTILKESGGDVLDDATYTQLSSATFEQEVTNAMAAGRGPDLVLVSDSSLLFFGDKIQTIPYGAYSQGSFLSSFVDESSLFLRDEGIRALPILIDPLVIYWNRNVFSTAGIANPPQYWNDLLAIAPKLTSFDASQNVRRSAVAMGTWRNVANAKPLLATLMLQAGEPIVSRDEFGQWRSNLGGEGGTESAAASALRFYTEFANPGKTTYSWNNSLPNSTNAFLAGDVGIYVGFASEYALLRERNPNLRFDAAVMPQLRSGPAATFGRITGVALSLSTDNQQGALAVAQYLSSKSAIAALVGVSGLPSVRRDVPVDTSASATAQVFAQSALIARGWLDPNQAGTDMLFKDMIESVLSGEGDPSFVALDAVEELNALLKDKK